MKPIQPTSHEKGMNMDTSGATAESPHRAPTRIGFALLSLAAVTAVLVIGLVVLKAPLPLMMAAAFLVALGLAKLHGVSYETAENTSFEMIKRGLQPLLIFVAVGALISSWIMSGTVPSMIYYGLQLIHPAWFLPAALILSAIAALVNGTNFGTVATVGVALMGVALALGIPAPIAAGAVLCGAVFGDKMSPLSDTTVMAPGLSGSRLMPHIRHMLWTTVPSILISLIIFTVIGFGYGSASGGTDKITEVSTGLQGAFEIGLVPLIPPIIVLGLLIARVPAFPAIAIGAILGAVIAVVFQGAGATQVMNAMWSGYTPPADLGALGNLLSGGETGGALKMLGLASIVIFALGIAGAFTSAGIMQSLLNAITPKLDTPRKLVPATIVITFFLNMLGGAVNFAVAMGATFLRPVYERMGLAPKNLSRAVEDSGTMTGPLIPWNATAVFTAGALGVSTAEYIPFAFFCFLCPIFSLIYGLTGFTIVKTEDVPQDSLQPADELSEALVAEAR